MAVLVIGIICFVPLALMVWDLVAHTRRQETSGSAHGRLPATR